jgi:DNA-directed RNA polymerase sigma subunit (sigma70/sigma32)
VVRSIPVTHPGSQLRKIRMVDFVGTFGELLADRLAEGEYERVIDAIEEQEPHTLLAGLSDRERAILRARYGLDGEEQWLRHGASQIEVPMRRGRGCHPRARDLRL